MNREQLEEIRARAAEYTRLLAADVEDGNLAGEVAVDVPALLDEIDRRPVVNVDRLRELAGALNRMQAKHPHGNYVGYGDAILDAIGEEPGYLGRTTAEGGTSKGSSEVSS